MGLAPCHMADPLKQNKEVQPEQRKIFPKGAALTGPLSLCEDTFQAQVLFVCDGAGGKMANCDCLSQPSLH